MRYSIFWKRSSHSLKKSIREKTNHLAFDAYTALLRTGELLNAYVEAMEQQPPEVEDWKQIIWHLTQAARTIEKENKSEIYRRQLILFPELLKE